MDNDSLIYVNNVKNSFYEKGVDLVNVHLYIRDVEEHEIIFEESKVIVKFTTKNPRFVKQHAGSNKGKHSFCHVINTREQIDCAGCFYNVRAPFIELVLKKKVAQKWKSLQVPTDVCALAELTLDGKKKSKGQSKRSKESQRVLGGKSTPVKTSDEKKPDADVKTENRASSSKTEDERNIKKAVYQHPEHGLTGLENYANNCYMNVVIQILANIQETRDYFKNDHYLKDINANNPLSSGGKVAKAFADVTNALWSVSKNAFKPSALKNIMGKRYSLFLGWQQHDAQEFFSSLLDNLHEDLNQAHSDKGAEKESNKVDAESTVNEKPDTAWAAHIKRNNSFIVKLFHGQLMSKLTCAACHKVSYSYDPCAQISLPILTSKLSLKILFFTRDINKPPLMVSMQISTPNAKVWHLKNMLHTVVKVPSHLISLYNGAYSVCTDEQAPVLSVRKYKYVIASEISSKEESEFFSIPVFQYVLHSGQFIHCDNCFTPQSDCTKLKRCTRCLVVAYCTRDCQTKHWNVHSKTCAKDSLMQVGVPFHVTLRKDSLTYESLEGSLKDRAKFSVEMFSTSPAEECSNVDIPNEEKLEDDKQSQRLSLNSSAVCIIKVSNKPFNDESTVIVNSENFTSEIILKAPFIILEWQNTPEGDVSNNLRTKTVPMHDLIQSDSNIGVSEGEDQCSIYDCLRSFMEPESLDKKDSWKCPKCKSLQAAKKEMAISTPPGLLLLHLKRFTYGDFGQKINKAVTYPLNNFDLSPFIAKETRSKIDHALKYDLCGVITHRGSMRMGHYTCLVRMLGMNDEEEVGWRFFDDDSVYKIGSEKVASSDAYVLVYRLQGAQEVLKLESIYSDNVVKRKTADSVASSTVNLEKVLKYNLNATENETDCLMKHSLDHSAISELDVFPTIPQLNLDSSETLTQGELCKSDASKKDPEESTQGGPHKQHTGLDSDLPSVEIDERDKIEGSFDNHNSFPSSSSSSEKFGIIHDDTTVLPTVSESDNMIDCADEKPENIEPTMTSHIAKDETVNQFKNLNISNDTCCVDNPINAPNDVNQHFNSSILNENCSIFTSEKCEGERYTESETGCSKHKDDINEDDLD